MSWKHGLAMVMALLAVCLLPMNAWASLPSEKINLLNPGFEAPNGPDGWLRDGYYDPAGIPAADPYYGTMYFTTANDSHTGSRSLLLFSNHLYEFGPMPYIEVFQPLDVHKGDIVTATFWTKGKGSYGYMKDMGTPWPPNSDDIVYLTANSTGWVKQTITYVQPDDTSDMSGYIMPGMGIWYAGGGNSSILFDDFTVAIQRNTVVPNPGFEAGYNGLLHWTPFTSGIKATIATIQGYYPLLPNGFANAVGTHGLRLAKADYVKGSGAYFGVASDLFTVHPGTATVSYATNGTAQGPLYVKIDMYKNSSMASWITSRIAAVPSSAAWQRNSFSLTIPQGTTRARIVLVAYNNCNIAADDFEVAYT